MTNKLSHLNDQGEINMVDVSSKSQSIREATASGKVVMAKETFEQIQLGNTPKGDIIATAKIAGIMAAKQTSNLIPLCHPLPLQKIAVVITGNEQLACYDIEVIVKTKAETGVEMEALTAVSVAALTIYDMAKAIDKSITITDIKLVSKKGGKSDYLSL
ncbi:MAG: cyclic pyranopterin monophosphate synthase MoaC [Cyanobacteria bacterium]|nr:cyclic pyranopterin monophosphate synthase MoaC [Cyanobacteria bacterium CG_2015-16_32_12]NCO77945.1 cyclic pyranopterin monophosphate synthase MoaC [Cyanobacteria bacterium CG_2015-22_32_23]NCQ05660.1 cyclic pyranopterin monophosphate synthase MoaC [Cyanobacteria bacterium CG_2015-09_32_10]NCQ42747.1 cyclic pyranopterin monophosphate synthase MoaC [Cyanobacteria bacterium CG_2015-04_32_10]NCS85529.1 cyclic pyranopterin monophosphate synthase MoaC [Cyanobacteria bacterium CG_2015-02_32_10]